MRIRYVMSVVALALCLQARADIVGMWLFEEGAGDVAVDASGRGHDGVLMDGTGWGAGAYGGQIVAQGTSKELMNNPDSLTGQYLSGKKKIEVKKKNRK